MEPLPAHSTPSIFEELEKAEEDHLKNCPNAEFSIRLASVVVDGILTYLATTGLQKLSKTLEVLILHYASAPWTHSSTNNWMELLKFQAPLIRGCIEIGFKVLFIYTYFIASTSYYGGSPGKLLMGLRVLRANTGKRLNQGQALYRLVIALITNLLSFGISYLAMTISEDGTTYHDRITHTTVKKVHGVK